MIEINNEILRESEAFEYNLIHTEDKNKGTQTSNDDVFFHIQNNLIERHGRGFDNKLVRPTAVYNVERTNKPLVAKSMKIDEFEDDEVYYCRDEASFYFRYYLKGERFLEFIDNLYDKYIDVDMDLVMYYASTFSTLARDKDIDLTDFEDVSKIPKIHNFLIRGYRGTI